MDAGRFLGFLGLGLLQCCFRWLICFGIVVAMVWCFGLVVLVLCFGDLIDLWWGRCVSGWWLDWCWWFCWLGDDSWIFCFGVAAT